MQYFSKRTIYFWFCCHLGTELQIQMKMHCLQHRLVAVIPKLELQYPSLYWPAKTRLLKSQVNPVLWILSRN